MKLPRKSSQYIHIDHYANCFVSVTFKARLASIEGRTEGHPHIEPSPLIYGKHCCLILLLRPTRGKPIGLAAQNTELS